MVKDRLPELQQALREQGLETHVDNGVVLMSEFFTKAQEIENQINNIKKQIENLVKIKSNLLTKFNDYETSQSLKKELENLTSQVRSHSHNVKTQLKTLEFEIDKNKTISKIEQRIQKSRSVYLNQIFAYVMIDLNRCQAEYRDFCKNRLRRDLDIAGVECNSSELESMLDTDKAQVFNREILIGIDQSKRALYLIEERHNELLKIEKSISEINELFNDLAILVETQGDIVDRIDKNFGETKEYVAEGDTKLNQAQNKKKSSYSDHNWPQIKPE
ncbi:unnamed protein product [Brachionus calyciflorus]|uniref:t-SNARE coiled-coil homology domain-containing protein n=1 Tax=Brachionus calyciflorus TaxID=104777 RepID=A0A814GCG4_9BILA|nr:unnamed protein product [Brachionus calyciflorus]